MHPLDNPATYLRLDPQDMAGAVRRFPDMGDDAWRTAMRVRLPETIDVTAVVVLGMGGSGVGGDLLQALLAPSFPVPIVVVKNARIPASVGPQTLVFACSYSGNTRETLEAYAQAKAAAAPAIVISSGGKLRDEAARFGDPIVEIPGGLAPRAALPYLFLPMVNALRRLTHLGELSGEWAEARDVLRGVVAAMDPKVAEATNPAKQLAGRLVGKLPAVYASSPALGPAAYRWKCQFNENSKTLALWGAFPELTHNEIVGWENADLAGRISVVLLREPDEGQDIAGRIAATRSVAFARAAAVDEVQARGSSRLARLLSLVLFGDFVSVYLALLCGVDPFPVPSIDRVKAALLS